MALLAEEIVEEWLNRQGYFTIRGIKLGVHEIDLLATRPNSDGWDCRHFEVQASVRPVSYLTQVPKAVQRDTGRARSSARSRSDAELKTGVQEWIAKKYDLPAKKRLKGKLAAGKWTRELVVNVVRHPEEVIELARQGITVHRLNNIVREMMREEGHFKGAISGDLLDLMNLLETDA